MDNFRADDEMLASEHAIIFKQHIWLTTTTKVSFQWCTIWDISEATGGILLRFKLDWKLDILAFQQNMIGPLNHPNEREKHV